MNTEHAFKKFGYEGRERPWLRDKQVGEGLFFFLMIFKDFIIYPDCGTALAESRERETKTENEKEEKE